MTTVVFALAALFFVFGSISMGIPTTYTMDDRPDSQTQNQDTNAPMYDYETPSNDTPMDNQNINNPASQNSSSQSAGATDPETALQGQWMITSVADASLPADTPVTLTVTGPQISIFTGCNTISATAMFAPTGLLFRDVTSTKVGCDPLTQALESKLTALLNQTDLIVSFDPGTSVSLYDAANVVQLSARKIQ